MIPWTIDAEDVSRKNVQKWGPDNSVPFCPEKGPTMGEYIIWSGIIWGPWRVRGTQASHPLVRPVRATPRGAQLPIGVAGLLCTGVSRPWTPGKIVGPSINCSISLGINRLVMGYVYCSLLMFLLSFPDFYHFNGNREETIGKPCFFPARFWRFPQVELCFPGLRRLCYGEAEWVR